MENISPTHRVVHMAKQSNNAVEGLTKDVQELIKSNITHGNSKLTKRTAGQTTLVIAIEDFRKKYILKYHTVCAEFKTLQENGSLAPEHAVAS